MHIHRLHNMKHPLHQRWLRKKRENVVPTHTHTPWQTDESSLEMWRGWRHKRITELKLPTSTWRGMLRGLCVHCGTIIYSVMSAEDVLRCPLYAGSQVVSRVYLPGAHHLTATSSSSSSYWSWGCRAGGFPCLCGDHWRTTFQLEPLVCVIIAAQLVSEPWTLRLFGLCWTLRLGTSSSNCVQSCSYRQWGWWHWWWCWWWTGEMENHL